MPLFAHSLPGTSSPADWEPLYSVFGGGKDHCSGTDCMWCQNLDSRHGHANKVAYWAAEFAKAMFGCPQEGYQAGAHAYLAGLWHDLGKFAPEWQRYLAAKGDPHTAEVTQKLDHSSAGAQHAIKQHTVIGHFLAYPIAGHHSGLLDATANGACQRDRIRNKNLPVLGELPADLAHRAVGPLPAFLKRDGFAAGFYTRMLFSCLVDADFLATEAFMNPAQAFLRNATSGETLHQIAAAIDAAIDAFPTPGAGDPVGTQRRRVVEDCRAAADLAPGLFTLTVPTGGGKTLSSLSFALRHALRHGQRRVINVAPFTAIIEQNAQVIRKILAPLESCGQTLVLEHHSGLSPEQETDQSRLAAENWDAPIVVTTAVQFYESLFAAKTSSARKVHNIANSVVILDEAQSLPVDYLKPCLRVLQELSDNYRTSVVLCTATQPAIHHDAQEFPIGLVGCREIISDKRSLFRELKRVDLQYSGRLSDAELAVRLNAHSQVLCIVNRRRHAQQVFQLLDPAEGNFHLSALMCPAHRLKVLEEIRHRLHHGLPTRVVATQLVEAGVDLDFPVVYRALAGLDSIAQAAGRCNRHGKLERGVAYIFKPEDQKAEAYFRDTAQVAEQLLDLHPDLLGEEAIHHYFDLYYYRQSKRWDSKRIVDSDSFRLDGSDPELPLKFQFARVADDFKLIENDQVPVIIAYDEAAKRLIGDLKNPHCPLSRRLLRGLQRYCVQIPCRMRDEHLGSFQELREGQFHLLVSNELNYSESFGLILDESHANNQTLICGS